MQFTTICSIIFVSSRLNFAELERLCRIDLIF
nr:MAG TPA: Increased Sodium Tolerance 1 (IST1)-III, IST1, CHMP1B, membrane tubulation.0A [Caudoviricetes sp.]